MWSYTHSKSSLLNEQTLKMLQSNSSRQIYHRSFKSSLLSHNHDPLPKEEKPKAKCAPINYYNPQSWEQMLQRTLTVNDLVKAKPGHQKHASIDLTNRIIVPQKMPEYTVKTRKINQNP